MKKIFSLAAVTGMFMLMSFSFGAEKLPSEELQDFCHEYGMNGVASTGAEGDAAYIIYGALYDSCLSNNEGW